MPTYEHLRDNFINPVVYENKDYNISIKVFGNFGDLKTN
jgi:hypothetical protein